MQIENTKCKPACQIDFNQLTLSVHFLPDEQADNYIIPQIIWPRTNNFNSNGSYKSFKWFQF